MIRTVLTAAILAGLCALGPAGAQQKQIPPAQPAPRVIIVDPNFNRPPPMPPDRPYVGPGPATSAPMERITPVAPLSQPPIR